jgi:hypothetical protein
MVSTLLMQGRALATPLAALFANTQAWMDSLLVRADVPPMEGQPKSGGFPVWAIVVIAVVLILCLLPVCIIGILTLLGPAIGNVFSNIIDNT